MANWNLPTVNSGYINFVTEMNDKFKDVAQMLYWSGPINLPSGAMRFSRDNPANYVFEETDGTGWFVRPIGVGGGGTGANNASSARINLGLGSMATQNSNAVTITGGTITGVAVDISSVTGVVALSKGGTGQALALGSQGSYLGSYGGIVQFLSGTYLTELNASALTVGTIPAGRLTNYAVLSGPINQFGNTGNIFISYGGGQDNFAVRSVYPLINWDATTDPPATRTMRAIYGGGALNFQAINEGSTVSLNVLTLTSSGGIIGNGFYLTNLNANSIAAGRVGQQFLGIGGYDASTFLRGDGYWAVPPTGSGGGGGAFVPSGMIALFDTNCPAGWTRYSALDNRFPLGSSGAGGVGGSNDHSHLFDVTSASGGNHDHSFGGSFGGSGSGSGNFGGNTGGPSNSSTADAGGSFDAGRGDHTHGYNVAVNLNVNVTTNIDGRTGAGGDHSHRVAGGTGGANHIPPYYTMVFCRKD